MKTVRQKMILVGVILVLVCGLFSAASGEVSLTTGLRYDSFGDDLSPKTEGSEVTVPLGLSYRRSNFFLSIESAYSSASVDLADDSGADLSSLSDTLVSASYVFSDLPVGIIIGVDANVPTGNATLTEQERRAEFGENNDFFEVDDFGQGFNLGLSLGLLQELSSLQAGITGAYIFYGEFDPSDEIPNDELNPGDQLVAVASLDWQANSLISVAPFISYTYFFEDEVAGMNNYQEGAKYAFGADIYFDMNKVGLMLSLYDVYQGKNQRFINGSLDTEPDNSNGNRVYGTFDLTYLLTSKLSLELFSDIRYYAESDRKDEEGNLPFSGQRTRYTIGPGFSYDINERIAVNGLLRYLHISQERDLFVEEDTGYNGAKVNLGLRYTF